MYIKHIDEIEKTAVIGDGIKDVLKQVAVGEEHGWKENTLRVFTVLPGGNTPKHSHDWEHVNYVISGTGTLELDGEKKPLTKGSFAFVPPNIEHQFSNSGDEDYVMICIVPSRGEY